LGTEFEDRSFFETLRLEPYYLFTAERNPSVRGFIDALIDETRATRAALVHGDYSPKNILIYRDTLILLDHEVIHFGDPAFDLGFAMTHLLSKAHHLPALRSSFASAAGFFWRMYFETVGALAGGPGFEARVVRHTLGCLLARIDGRSPLEYLTPSERERQKSAVLALMADPPAHVSSLIEQFIQRI
jgi:hypothetical protein